MLIKKLYEPYISVQEKYYKINVRAKYDIPTISGKNKLTIAGFTIIYLSSIYIS